MHPNLTTTLVRSREPEPHPAHVHVRVRLRDGGTALLRPLAGGEVSVLEGVFAGLSGSSRHQRFLVPMPRLPETARRTLSDVDGHRHVAWAALVDGLPVGLCRFVRTAPDTAEIAFEVVDAEQGRGIGSALVDAVATVADAAGITRLEATVAPDNAASIAVLERIGVRLHPDDGLLAGRGRLRLPEPARVDRRAVLALSAQVASRASTAAATSSSRRSAPCLATS